PCDLKASITSESKRMDTASFATGRRISALANHAESNSGMSERSTFLRFDFDIGAFFLTLSACFDFGNIVTPLLLCCAPRRNDLRNIFAFSMSHDYEGH